MHWYLDEDSSKYQTWYFELPSFPLLQKGLHFAVLGCQWLRNELTDNRRNVFCGEYSCRSRLWTEHVSVMGTARQLE